MKISYNMIARTQSALLLASALSALLVFDTVRLLAQPARSETKIDPKFERWLKPQAWQRDSETPALSLGEKGKFDDQHIFAPHVIRQEGEFWMYYSGSQRCVDAGIYKGVAKDPEHPANPVFKSEPGHDWESHFTTSQTLMRLPDGSFRLWYAGRRQPPWSSLYFAIGMVHWNGPEK